MAFAKSRKGGSQESKSLGEMSREPSSSLGSIVELGLSNERQDQGIEASHDFSRVADGHPCSIFFQSHVAAIMRAGFNAPMRTANLEELLWGCLGPCQTGNAEFDFARGAITFSVASPLKLTLQAIDLRQARPSCVSIQHFAGGEGSGFDPTMAFVDFLGCPKIRLDFPKAGFRIFRGKEGLDVFIQ